MHFSNGWHRDPGNEFSLSRISLNTPDCSVVPLQLMITLLIDVSEEMLHVLPKEIYRNFFLPEVLVYNQDFL